MRKKSRRPLYLSPIDFSRDSEAALDVAQQLAKRDHAKVLAVHVISTAFMFPLSAGFSEIFVALEKNARREMAKLSRRKRLKPSQALIVNALNPGDAIAATAKKHRAAMIIMASHGKSGFERFTLGSVAERTVRTADCPVLIVKGGRIQNAKTVVAPYDFSRGADKALKVAVRTAETANRQLVLLNIVPPVVNMAAVAGAIRGELEVVAKRARLKTSNYRLLVLERPDAAHAIAQAAKKLNSAMIVMGSHGRSGFQRLLLGSVTERTLRYAECPVLVIK
jgi:nucleotide-binding universal stress UspA family protein